MRRTSSLDALYLRPSWTRTSIAVSHCNVIQVDKATQTDDSYLDNQRSSRSAATEDLDRQHITQQQSLPPFQQHHTFRGDTQADIKIEKVLRQRLQKCSQRGGGGEHSVSSQTLSPIHGKNKHFNFSCDIH